MSASTFRALLAQATDAVERPRSIADGHYIGVVKNTEFGVSSRKQTPYMRINLTPEEETDDVPEEANKGIDLLKRELHRDFYITPSALYRLTDLLDAVLGKQAGRSFDERIPELRGARVLFGVTHRDNAEGTETFNDVTTIVAA